MASVPPEVRNARDRDPLDTFGRLAPGVTIAQAQADLQNIVTHLAREYPRSGRELEATVTPYRSGIVANTAIAQVFLLMMAAVTFVLLIACANMANLVLARAAARSRDVSLRMSLARLAMAAGGQLLAGLVIGGAGAMAVGRVLLAMLFGTFAGDPLTVGALAALLLAVGAAACVLPARRAVRLDPVAALRAE